MPCTAKKTTKPLLRAGTITLSPSKVINARLLTQLKTIAETQQTYERFVDIQKARGRITCRIVSVFTDLRGIDLDWVGVQSLIQIERIGIRSGKKYIQTNYYISSLASKATNFG